MNLIRRQLFHLAAGAVAVFAIPGSAVAQAYPNRAVRMIVGTAPGGSTDMIGRLMGLWLTERLGQQFVIENRPGGGTNIATEAVVKATADGYTLLVPATSSAINATLYEKLGFSFIRDIAPVASLIRVPNVIVVNLAMPAKTLPELIAHAKANPGKINAASPGSGTGPHMSGELFKLMAGISMAHIPYRGTAPANTDLLGGHVQLLFTSVPAVIELIKAGKMRALAVTTAERSQKLPDLPTVGETVAGYEASTWWGIAAPKGTPNGIIDKLNKEINAAFTDPKMQARLSDLDGTLMPGSPAQFAKLIVDETAKWAKVVKFSGVKPE
jgi:tripartite-type tricarboxylate transporter receptor subunit TctC